MLHAFHTWCLFLCFPAMHAFTHSFIHSSIHPFIHYLSIHPSIHPSIQQVLPATHFLRGAVLDIRVNMKQHNG